MKTSGCRELARGSIRGPAGGGASAKPRRYAAQQVALPADNKLSELRHRLATPYL